MCDQRCGSCCRIGLMFVSQLFFVIHIIVVVVLMTRKHLSAGHLLLADGHWNECIFVIGQNNARFVWGVFGTFFDPVQKRHSG